MPTSFQAIGLFALLCFVSVSGCDAFSAEGSDASLNTGTPAPGTRLGIVPRLVSGTIGGDGNSVCKDARFLGTDPGWWGFAVGSPIVGTTPYGDFEITVSTDGRTLGFFTTGASRVRYVVVQGAQDTHVYSYDGTALQDTRLVSPPGTGGVAQRIIRYTVCYDEAGG